MTARLPERIASRLSLPLIAAPMFKVSSPALVIAACNEGVIGAIPTLNARPIEQLTDWLAEIKAGLKAGTFAIWKGPIVGQDGKEVLKKDEVADDKFLGGVNFYVKGVEGSIPSGK